MAEPGKNGTRDTRKWAIVSAIRILKGQLQDPNPEERLWFAVIEHAVRAAYSATAGTERMRDEAREWIASEAFDEVARAIGLHPPWARSKILRIPDVIDRV